MTKIAVVSLGEIIENSSVMPINFINPAYSYPRIIYYIVIVGTVIIFTYANVMLLGNIRNEK